MSNSIKEILLNLKQANDASRSDLWCCQGMPPKNSERLFSDGYSVYRGKVREVFRREDVLQIFHTDRLTAFDTLVGYVPFKGMILNAISSHWLGLANREGIPTYFDRMINSRTLAGRYAEPIRAEVVVRGYLAGSMARSYAKDPTEEFCGTRLPAGLSNFAKLPAPVITPTTKAAAFEHDVNISPQALIESGVCSAKEWETISELAHRLFKLGSEEYARCGWIMADTKYEFGRCKDGQIIVIDEIHTPDSTRLWVQSSYAQKLALGQSPEMLDKENVRSWILENGYKSDVPGSKIPNVPPRVLAELSLTYLGVAEALRCEGILLDPVG